MNNLKKIKLFAIDSDGVLLNDTYSPVIKQFVEKRGIEYTADIERHVWGSPQIVAGHNMALACKLPYSGEATIKSFFKERDLYLKSHPVEVMEGIEHSLALLKETGAKIVCYGGRNKEYSFDKFLHQFKDYFDLEIPYVDINAFRPGVYEIAHDIFGYDFDEVVYFDDINRVAEVCKAFKAGFIGVPANQPHNFQKAEMKETNVKFMVDNFSELNESIINDVDCLLAQGNFWN